MINKRASKVPGGSKTTDFTADQIVQTIQETVRGWVKTKGSPKRIAEDVCAELDNQRRNIIRTALGFRDGFGMEVCKTSPVFEVYANTVRDIVKDWLAEHASEFQPTREQMAALQVEFISIYNRRLKEQVCELARRQAEEDALAVTKAYHIDGKALAKAANEVVERSAALKAAEQAVLGHQFTNRSIITKAEVEGIVAYKAGEFNSILSCPEASCWYVIRVHNSFGHTAQIIMNGSAWHPVELSRDDNGAVIPSSARPLDHFENQAQMIFNYMGVPDKEFLNSAIKEYCQRQTD